jgi:hypothetical protein
LGPTPGFGAPATPRGQGPRTPLRTLPVPARECANGPRQTPHQTQASAAHARAAPAVGTEAGAEGGGDYFLDALLRSFLLGVGAGALVETTHVLFKFLGLAASSGPEIMGASAARERVVAPRPVDRRRLLAAPAPRPRAAG